MQPAGSARLALILSTLAGAGLRFFGLDAQPLWLDEAFSLWVARLPVLEIPGWLVQIDHHPPLYYALLAGWISGLGTSEWALRSLSALLSVVAVPLTAVAARRLVGREAALVAAILVALAPFQVRYAQEARMYALLMVAVTATLACLAQALRSPRPGWGVWVGIAGCQAVAMWTHNVAAVLLPLALNLAVLAAWLYLHTVILSRQAAYPERREGKYPGFGARGDASAVLQHDSSRPAAQTRPGRQARRDAQIIEWDGLRREDFLPVWLRVQAGALLFWLPWVWPCTRQVLAVDAHFWIPAPTLQSLMLALQTLTIGRLPLWWSGAALWTTAAAALALWGLWRMPRPAGLLTGLLAATPVAAALLAGVRRPIFAEHTLIWVMGPWLTALAAGVVGLRVHTLRIAAFVTLLALNGLGLWAYTAEFAKERWDEAARVVAEEAAPGDLVLFHASWVQLAFDYYAGDLPGVEKRGVPVTLFARGVLEPRMTAADVPALMDWQARDGDVWLVYSHGWYTDPDGLVPATLDRVRPRLAEWIWPEIVVIRYGKAVTEP